MTPPELSPQLAICDRPSSHGVERLDRFLSGQHLGGLILSEWDPSEAYSLYTASPPPAGRLLVARLRRSGQTDYAEATLEQDTQATGRLTLAGGRYVVCAWAATDPRTGLTVQVSNGEWSQAPGSFGYQWQRCNPNGRRCTTIAGATASTYAVTSADVGSTLVAVVQAVAGSVTQPVLSTRALVTA